MSGSSRSLPPAPNPPAPEDLARRSEAARRFAGMTAAAVAALGLVLLVVPALVSSYSQIFSSSPDHYTTVTRHVTGNPGDQPRRVISHGSSPGTETITSEDAGIHTETTINTSPAPFTERVLSSGGLVLIRLLVVGLVSFMAGAIVQRIYLGHYAFRIGPVEMGDLPKASTVTLEAVEQLKEQNKIEIDKLRDKFRKEMDESEEAINKNAKAIKAVAQAVIESDSAGASGSGEDLDL